MKSKGNADQGGANNNKPEINKNDESRKSSKERGKGAK